MELEVVRLGEEVGPSAPCLSDETTTCVHYPHSHSDRFQVQTPKRTRRYPLTTG